MIYTVFSTSNSPYQNWQSELLEYSWKRARQQGELIRLVATDDTSELPTHRYARTVATPSWRVHPSTGDNYAPYNKPSSLLEWLCSENPHGTVLLLDPDCVFRAPVEIEVEEGRPVSQTWINFRRSPDASPFGLCDGFEFLTRHCVNTEPRADDVMIPTIIHTSDLRRISGRWLELCGVVRQEARNSDGNAMWESDMFAYMIATAEYGLRHENASLGVCTNWPPESVPDAPIIHYCQPILSREGEPIFAKGTYTPWQKIDDPSQAKEDYGRDFLTMLNDYIDRKDRPDLDDLARPKRRSGVKEGRVGDDTVLLPAGATAKAFWLNPTGREIWELADGTRTVAEISRTLAERYSVNEDDLEDELKSAILRMQEYDVVDI